MALVALALAPLAVGQSASPAAQGKKIVAVRVTGSKRFSGPEIVRASGLRPGQPFSSRTIKKAETRLLATGAFTEIDPTYVPAPGGYTIALKVTDAGPFLPVHFEGFGRLTEAQIQAALAGIPLYHGQLPLMGGTLLQQVRDCLRQLAHGHHLAGDVTYALRESGGHAGAIVFRLEPK